MLPKVTRKRKDRMTTIKSLKYLSELTVMLASLGILSSFGLLWFELVPPKDMLIS